MSESITVPPDLFKGLKFCLIDDGDNVDKIKTMLLCGGGTHNSYLSDMVTHVICDNPDNEGVSEAQELFEKPVITSRWVTLSSKCNKLLPLTGFSAIKNQLFYGLVFCPSQMSVEDKKKLWAMATYFGGSFQVNFNKSCTHLVVGKPEGAKYEKALACSLKVITPDWILDSIHNKYLCDEDLYHPKLLILPQPKVLHVPSPESTSLTSALMSLDKINIDASIAAPSQSDHVFLQNFSQNIKLSSLENKLADDILGNLPAVHSIKTEPNVVQYSSEQSLSGNRIVSIASSLPQQLTISTRPLSSPSSQALYQQQQQQLQHQQMLQQGEQKLNQALQQIQQAQQQPNLQQRPQLQPGQAQILQQKGQWPQQQQRMTLAQQQQIQHHILQMQRLRNLQQQQQLRSRQGLPPAQFAQLQQLQQQQQNLQQQQQNLQQQQQQNLQQPSNSQSHLQRQPSPSTLLQKQVQINVQQIPHQQGLASQGQQSLMQSQLLQPQQPSGQNPQAQMQIQLQAQLRQQQQQQQQQQTLSQLQLQQQALQKHQLQQQLQQQLLKQQHLQHLQQQQQQQTQINQQRALTQSPNMPPSPLHIQQQQQQNILQPSPRQSPLQQSPLQHSLQHSPQQPGVQLQHQQPSPLPAQRPQTPHQQPSPQQPHHPQLSVPLSPLQQAQQIALEKAAQQSAVEKQQTELIKVQLKQAALERAQAIEKARLQQTLEKVQMQQAALEKAQLQSGIENPHLQQNLLQHAQLQRSASHQLQIQQQLHQLQLQKAGLHQSIQQSQQGSPKIEVSSSAQSPQISQSISQFTIQQGQLQAVSKPTQLQGSAQQIQQQQHNAAQRLQLQQLQQRLQLQQSSSAQRLQIQGSQGQQLQQGSNIHPLQAQLQLQQGAALQQLSQAGNSGQSLQHPTAQSLSQGSPAQLQQVSQQLRMQQSSPAQQVQLQQGSPAQGSPAQLQQGSPAHSSMQLQGSPSAQHIQLQQGSPAQHLQLSQGSPVPHSQVQQSTQGSSPSMQQVGPQQSQVQVPSQQISQHSQLQMQSQAQMQQMSPQQGQLHQTSQIQQIISQQDALQQATMQTNSQSPLDGHSQSPLQTSLQQPLKQMPTKQTQLTQPAQQISSPLNQIPNQSQMQLPQGSQSQEIQQLQLQMSQQQQGHPVQSGLDINQSSAQSPIRQASPIQMQFHPTQAQLQKLQLQRAQQSQLQQASTQQILLKQVSSQSQMQQGLTQSGNQQIQLPQASVQQVHLHVLQQARLQALRQQQAQLQQSITQVTGSPTQTSQTSSAQVSNLQQGQLLQESQLQHAPGQVIRQTPQGMPAQNPPQTPRMPSPLQQAQLQQLAQLQQAQLQKSQTVLQQNQLQTQLQQIQLRHSALQQARLQQPSSSTTQQLLSQGHLTRPQQQQPQVQTQIVAKQIQLQQQSSHIAPPQTPPSPQQQQQPRFPHQLSPALRAVQKQFPANAPPSNQPPMHGQPPVQSIHQQQLLQQRQLQQQLVLQQQLRQRQLQQQQQQQQQLQSPQHPPQQGVQQILSQQSVQQPVMMKPPPQYPYDRQQLQGQPRLQYPAQPRQLSPGQQSPRGPWPQQVPGQQTQFLRRSPGANPPPSPQWQHVQQPSPKEELNPSPQPSPVQQQQQVVWSQRQQVSADGRDTSTPAAVQQQWTPSQSPQQREQPPPQSLQWQQLKQLELRRQQLLQQQQQQQQRPGSQSSQFSPQSDPLGQTSPRQALAVPAQYQPQNAPSILSPGSIGGQPPTQVTPKTKTALANLLNTRLQTTGRAADGECNQVPMRSPQIVTPPAQSTSRRPSADAIMQPQNQIPERAMLPLIPQVIFHGHDNKLNVPSDLCLLGCVFCIQDYEKSSNNNVEMWSKVIVKHGGEVEESYSSKCTHVICENQRNSVVQQAMREGKRCVTAYWLNDVLEKKRLKFPWLAHHLPTPFSDDKPCKNQIISVTNFEAEERTTLKNIITVLGAKYTGYLTSHNTVVICKKIDGRKAKKAKEWRIPVVNVQWLHDLMFGHYEAIRLSLAHKYQQYDMDNPFAIDYALVPHLMAAWKAPIKLSEELIKKHEIEMKTAETSFISEKNLKKRGNEENLESEAKRFRAESPPLEENIPLTTQTPPDNENRPRVLFTGISKIKDLAKVVCQLGGVLATSEMECTHLVANEYARTVKFLCAIHSAKFVLTVEWISECKKQNKFVDEKQYILRDTENEKLFGFNMESILNKPERIPLFQEFVFYITPGVFPKPDILKCIIEAGGGEAVLKKAPSLRQIKAMEQKGRKFAIIAGENDLHLCKIYMEKKICVQNVEFILTNSIRQELDFTSFAYAL